MTPVSSEQAAERTTPHDLGAEQRVLGALLIDRDAIFRVADLLRAEDFYQAKHQRVYRAARGSSDARQVCRLTGLCTCGYPSPAPPSWLR